MKGRTLWCLSKYSEMIAVQNQEMFLPLFQIATDCLAPKTEFPLLIAGATAAGVFARKIKSMQLLDGLTEQEKRGYNIGSQKIVEVLLGMLKEVRCETN